MGAMRILAASFVVLAAACATDREASDPADNYGSVWSGHVSEEMAWQAACRAMAWGGGEIRVDSKTHEVRRGVMNARVKRFPDGTTSVLLLADIRRVDGFTPDLFWRRFHQALDLMVKGEPVPLDPPPLPPQET